MSPPEPTPDPTDALIETLRRHPARLDDLGRARIAATLGALPPPRQDADDAADDDWAATARPAARRWRPGLVAGCAAAAAVAAVAAFWVLAHRGAGRGAPAAPVALPTAAPTTTRDAGAGQRVLRLGSITATLRADSVAEVVTATRGAELLLRAGAIELEASTDEPVVLRAGEHLVTASRAAFVAAVDDRRLRLSVQRGALSLRRAGELRTTSLAAPGELVLDLAPDEAGSRAPAPPPRAPVSPRADEGGASERASAAPAPAAAAPPPPTTASPGAAPASSEPAGTGTSSADDGAALEALYRVAEDALAAGDVTAGRRALEELVARAPRDRRADAARFDLARLAEQARDLVSAKRWLGEVLTSGRDPVVREPAHRALCRLLASEGSPAAAECLAQLRREFPGSASARP